MSSLPAPAADSLEQSRKLCALIGEEIRENGGWIAFDRFMRLALYAPGLGYYSAGAAKFGKQGDFVTAPEISPLFGRTLARQAAEVLLEAPGDILELGAGSGRLALDLLLELERQEALPGNYLILEVSADLRQRQRQLFAERAPQLLSKVKWLDRLPINFRGLILANEVLDAVPVSIVRAGENELFERGVAMGEAGFVWSDRALVSGPLHDAAVKLALPPGYVSEIHLEAEALVRSLAGILQHGVLLLIDYGFGEGEYYHPQRKDGTLMCHYRQHSHDDPFYFPGLQDITSHVNFTGIAGAGIDCGLDFLGYTTQAHFLINCGILSILNRTSPDDAASFLPQSAELQRLTSPAEMGELFKVLAMGRNVGAGLLGFSLGDRSRLL